MANRASLVILLLAYTSWLVFSRSGWDMVVTLQLVWASTVVISYLSVLKLHLLISKFIEPAFPFVITFIVFFILQEMLDVEVLVPIGKDFNPTEWMRNPFLNLASWFVFNFVFGLLIFSCHKSLAGNKA